MIDDEPVDLHGARPSGRVRQLLRALQALWNAAPITAVDILLDPQIRQELSSLTDWPTIPQVFVKGELIGGADVTGSLRLRRPGPQARRGARKRARAARADGRAG